MDVSFLARPAAICVKRSMGVGCCRSAIGKEPSPGFFSIAAVQLGSSSISTIWSMLLENRGQGRIVGYRCGKRLNCACIALIEQMSVRKEGDNGCNATMFKFFLLLLTSFLICAQTSAASLEPVRLQLKWQHQFQFAGYYAALEKGYYRDAGLEVEIIPSVPGQDPFRQVLDGKAEYGVGTTDLLLLREQGEPGSRAGGYFSTLATGPDGPEKAGVQSLHDFIGQPLMIEPGSPNCLPICAVRASMMPASFPTMLSMPAHC